MTNLACPRHTLIVTTGLDPVVHAAVQQFFRAYGESVWITGSSPVMTNVWAVMTRVGAEMTRDVQRGPRTLIVTTGLDPVVHAAVQQSFRAYGESVWITWSSPVMTNVVGAVMTSVGSGMTNARAAGNWDEAH